MNVKDIQDLLTAISRTLAVINEFPVFEEVIENDSYYTMSDLSMGDAIQALDEIGAGIENVNAPDQFSDLYLIPELETALAILSERATSIIRADRASRPCENKGAAKEVARQVDTIFRGGSNV